MTYSVHVMARNGLQFVHPMADCVDLITAECVRGYCELHGDSAHIVENHR